MIFPVIDAGDMVGYVARHTWSKEEIDLHNRRAARDGNYKILRWRNSTENDFLKLFYHYDGIVEAETDTGILTDFEVFVASSWRFYTKTGSKKALVLLEKPYLGDYLCSFPKNQYALSKFTQILLVAILLLGGVAFMQFKHDVKYLMSLMDISNLSLASDF